MSKSKRKTKIFGNCGKSEKKGKQLSNRAFRRKQNRLLKIKDLEDTLLPIYRNEGLRSYELGKDGKDYWEDAPESSMRK